MKTKSVLLVAVLVAAGVMTARANDPVNAGLFVLGVKSGVYKLIYEGEKEAAITLSILDSKGIVIYEERISKMKGFTRPVNLQRLKSDLYTFQVRQGNKLYKETVSHKSKSGTVSSKALAENRFAIRVTDLGVGIIRVKIYDAEGKLVKSHEEEVTGNFGKIFNLGNLQSGPFTFEIYSNTGLIDQVTF